MSTSNRQQQPTPGGGGPILAASRRTHAVAVEHQIRGMMELRAEAYEFPFVIAELAGAIRARVDYCTRLPVHPAYAQVLANIAATVDAAAMAARTLGPDFDALHRREIERLMQPRAAEEKWDTTANPGGGRG